MTPKLTKDQGSNLLTLGAANGNLPRSLGAGDINLSEVEHKHRKTLGYPTLRDLLAKATLLQP